MDLQTEILDLRLYQLTGLEHEKIDNEHKDLLAKIAASSIYTRAYYNLKENRQHVIICGDLSSTSLTELFAELFHEDHENDNLYARVLQGLWALIERQPLEARKELHQRLWEEMSESVGMCCEGHISRLVNVMVGFDDAFKPPISVNEMIQNKMSALSASGAPDAVHQAKVFMDGLAIPREQQAPWLEALA
jgi:hypothetical protein